MSKKRPTRPPESNRTLRQQAEARWKTARSGRAPRDAADHDAVVYELEVHQIELEIQNQELRETQFDLARAHDSYLDLYDFAPVGYVTLDAERVIRQANLTAATLLGMERQKLLGMRLERFVAKAARDALYLHLQAALGSAASQSCSLNVVRPDGSSFFAQLESTSCVAPNEAGAAYRVIISDITNQKRAEEALKALNESLEQRVAERTDAIQMLHDIASVANQSQNPQQAIEHCLHQLATYNGWSFGHALLPGTENRDELIPRYYCSHEESSPFRRFRDATLALRFRRGEGMPGRVFASGKVEWTTDVRSELIDSRAALAAELGLKTAIAFPMLVGDKVAGVMEFFSQEKIVPGTWISDAMVGVGIQLGRVIERAEFEEHLLEVAEKILQGIAQDLHDDIGQELTGLGLKAVTLAEMLRGKTMAGKLAADIAEAVDRTRGKVRGLSRGLLPVELEEGMLASVLQRLADGATTGSQVACTFKCLCPDAEFDNRVALHVYRIAQEAVSNAVRHGKARTIRITLDHDGNGAALAVADDGRGIPRQIMQTEGMGLRTMRYRADLIGGKLAIESVSDGGTHVVCRSIPLKCEIED